MLCVCLCSVDHLYTFFVEWSPDSYTKGLKKHLQPRCLVRGKNNKRYLVVEEDKAAMINKLLSSPVSSTATNWEVRTLSREPYRWAYSPISGHVIIG